MLKRKFLSTIFVASIPLLLTGCVRVLQDFYPTPTADQNPLDYAYSWINYDKMIPLIPNPLELNMPVREIYKDAIRTREGYDYSFYRWCSMFEVDRIKPEYSFTQSLTKLCEAKGGHIVKRNEDSRDPFVLKNWCQKPDTKEVLFGFLEEHIGRTQRCVDPTTDRRMVIASPIAGQEEAWIKEVNRNGLFYKTQVKEIKKWNAEQEAIAEREREKQREAERQKEQERLIQILRRGAMTGLMMHKRGLQICKKDPRRRDSFWLGFVEDFANGKVKVLVTDYYIDGQYRAGNVRQTLIWDDPNNWETCE